MSSTYFSHTNADLVTLLENLDANVKAGGDDIDMLELFLPGGLPRDDESTNLLWRVLTHRHSRITNLAFTEEVTDALAKSRALKVVKRWCQEFAVPRRQLIFTFAAGSREESREMLDDLREILQLPKNGVKTVWLDSHLNRRTSLFDLVLHPVLIHPNNELTELALQSFEQVSDTDAKALSLGLSSPHCQLEVLDMLNISVSVAGIVDVLEGLNAAASLTRLDWSYLSGSIPPVSRLDKTRIMRSVTRLLERSGNQVKVLKLRITEWQREQVEFLANALTSEHCQVEEVNISLSCFAGDDDSKPLTIALRHPNNRLKQLRIIGQGPVFESNVALGNCLQDTNCKLESLRIRYSSRYVDGRVAESVAEALRVCPTNRLKRLEIIGIQPVTVFRAFSESLRSSNNKLTSLHLEGVRYLSGCNRCQLYRRVRKSNLVRFTYDFPDSFGEYFNDPSMQITYTLLSVKHVARLGRDAWVRILPVPELIWTIATTLGWPLCRFQ